MTNLRNEDLNNIIRRNVNNPQKEFPENGLDIKQEKASDDDFIIEADKKHQSGVDSLRKYKPTDEELPESEVKQDLEDYIISEHYSKHSHDGYRHNHESILDNGSEKSSSGMTDQDNNDYDDFVFHVDRSDLGNTRHSHHSDGQNNNRSYGNEKEYGSPSKHRSNKSRKKGHRFARIIFLVLLSLIVLTVGLFFLLKNVGRSTLLEKSEELTSPKLENTDVILEDNGYTVKYKGHTYKYNENIANILFIGVDKTSLGIIDDVVGTGGQADALYLAAVDFNNKKITTFAIPRETMADIGVYASNGSYLGIQQKQICLAYAYGDGKTGSCNNLISAVERLFFGVNISSFIAMDLMGISAINDSIGGVEVVLNCDMKLNGNLYKSGETVHIFGSDAETFVRSRSMEELEANLDRMDRQKIYLNAFINKVVENTKKDIKTPLDIYNSASDYTITNIDAAKLTYLVTEFMQSGITMPNIQRIPGETEMGEQYAEYYIDKEKLYEMFLDVYYICIK